MSSIEEIVIDIQKGINRKNELYLRIKNLVYQLCLKYYPYARKTGYEFDDLIAVSWFGIERAIKAFRTEKGYKFITYLNFHIRNSIAEFLGFRGVKQLEIISLDEPIGNAEDLTLGDTLKDDKTEKVFNAIEADDISKELWQCVDLLPVDEKTVIEECYKANKSDNAISSELGEPIKNVRQIKQKALRKLRKALYNRERIKELAYKNVSVKRFNTTWTSSTERAVLEALRDNEKLKGGM